MHINSLSDLDKSIAELEQRSRMQKKMLVERVHQTVDHYRPGNLIKSALHRAVSSTDVGSTVLKTAGGIGAGYLAKNLLLGNPTSIVGRLAAGAIKGGVTNTLVHNADKISAWGRAIYKNLFKTKPSKTDRYFPKK